MGGLGGFLAGTDRHGCTGSTREILCGPRFLSHSGASVYLCGVAGLAQIFPFLPVRAPSPDLIGFRVTSDNVLLLDLGLPLARSLFHLRFSD